jgi:tight adherence protein B
MDAIIALAAMFVALAVILGILGIYLATRAEDPGVRRLRHIKEGRHHQLMPAPILRRHLSGVPVFDIFLARRERAAQLALELDRAGLRIPVAHFVALRLFLAIVALLLLAIMFGGVPLGLLMGVGGGMIGYMAPAFYLRVLQSRRLRKIEKQLPEALSIMSNALRAGFGFLQAMEAAARRLPPPLGPELARTLQDANLGASVEDALHGLVERCRSYDLELVVTAVLVQREVGGNLSEILDNTAHTIRERERIRGEIKTITTMQRWEGNVAALVPVALAAILLLANRQYLGIMVEEPIGRVLLVLAGIWQIIGIIIMRRIVSIEV